MRLWEKNIRQVVPYVPGEQPAGDKIIKLNTNENPYPPAPGVKRSWQIWKQTVYVNIRILRHLYL